MEHVASIPWHSVESLIEIGFQRSRVVMMNEAHSGDLRCVRNETKLLVWCGNSHHTKIILQPSATDTEKVPWVPMGYQFKQLRSIDPFVIDQTRSVRFLFHC